MILDLYLARPIQKSKWNESQKRQQRLDINNTYLSLGYLFKLKSPDNSVLHVCMLQSELCIW